MKEFIGKFVRTKRIERGMKTQRDLAEATGLSAAYINHIECGRRLITAVNLAIIADALNVTLDEMVGRTI